MKYLSRQGIEQIGERVIKAYRNLPDNKKSTLYRVDPIKLIEEVLKVNLEYHHLSLDGAVLGVTTPFSGIGYKIFDHDDTEEYFYFDGNTILVESDLKNDILQKGRFNFTLAHEAGHQILKMLFPNDYVGGYRKLYYSLSQPEYRTYIKDWEEWQANTLASILLMPKDLLMQAMFLFGFEGKIDMINKVYATKVYDRFSDMATFLGVSKKALLIRLKQLGLVERDYLDNPYELTDVYCEGGS